MRFKVFAKKLNRVICGKSNVQQFTRALFEYMIQDDVCVLLDDIKPDIFKLYYSENTGISVIAATVLAHLDDECKFQEYLESLGANTLQLLADEFKDDIHDINVINAATKITDLFLEILSEATGNKKSTPESAKKEEAKTPHDILTEKVLTSGQAIADVFGKTVSNLIEPTVTTSKLSEKNLNQNDLVFLERFKNQVEPLLTYFMDHAPTGDGTKLSLADEINDFLHSWKYDVRKTQDTCFRKIVIDAMQVLGDYTYYPSDKFYDGSPIKIFSGLEMSHSKKAINCEMFLDQKR